MSLLELALTDPATAIEQASSELDDARTQRDRALAGQALGIALRTFRNIDESVAVLRTALGAAESVDDAVLAADIRLTLAGSLAMTGNPDEAMAEAAEAAERALPNDQKARAWVQQAAFIARTRGLADALDRFDRAESVLRELNDERWLAILYNNRALVSAYSGRMEEAELDLAAGLELFQRLGFTASAAEIKHNLAWIRAQRGDLVGALDLYGEVETTLSAIRFPLNELLTDKVEALVFARLTREALDAAAVAVETVASDAAPIDLPEAWLMYARAALAAHVPDVALDAAVTAFTQFREIQAEGWDQVAQLIEMQARAEGGGGEVGEILQAATRARENGWNLSAVDGYLLAARLASRTGDDNAAMEALANSDELFDPAHMPATLRTQRSGVEALVHWQAGRRSEAADLASNALQTLHDYRTSIAATDLRASTAVFAEEATQLLVQVLAETEQLAELIDRVDKGRAASTNPPPVTASADPQVQPLVSQLRELTGEAASPAKDFDRIAASMREAESSLEAAVADGRTADIELDSLREVAVLSLMVGGEDIITLAVRGGEPEIESRAPLSEMRPRFDDVRAALATSSVESSALDGVLTEISEMLLPADLPEDRTIVISPPASLVSFPWTLLPPLRGRAICIAPRLSSFAALEGIPARRTSSALLAAGPGLETAGRELVGIEPQYDDANLLLGQEATPNAVLDGLRRSDVAHVACHARFRADNPLFSSLELATGPLFVHQLEELNTLPPLIVLAACDSAAVAPTGTDFTGFLSVLLGLGARTVIAATTAVPDVNETSELMIAFHAALSDGERPADALAQARRAVAGSGVGPLAAHTFQCFGWG